MTNDLNKLNAQRVEIEKQIARRLVRDILLAGHMVSVNDGEETVLKRSRSYRDIVAAMFSTDEDVLIVRTVGGKRLGAFVLVYGNGTDVLSDYNFSDDTQKDMDFLADGVSLYSDGLVDRYTSICDRISKLRNAQYAAERAAQEAL